MDIGIEKSKKWKRIANKVIQKTGDTDKAARVANISSKPTLKTVLIQKGTKNG